MVMPALVVMPVVMPVVMMPARTRALGMGRGDGHPPRLTLPVNHCRAPQPADPAPDQPQAQPRNHRMAKGRHPALRHPFNRRARQAQHRDQRVNQRHRNRRLRKA